MRERSVHHLRRRGKRKTQKEINVRREALGERPKDEVWRCGWRGEGGYCLWIVVGKAAISIEAQLREAAGDVLKWYRAVGPR